ncbi:MAG TPA: ribbon-helix-helix protein, CopG family [Candidatus Ruania gallistercoris]|uniref:Ribbon-helix-helix protein, CopG family n=1 Tax=Candidatus Ruania gallistercoris TaxID=2838746 RepID=A0A9D2J305_9MICO|nr:ribbon-helix-helix protein, CopG family [Candidatus Ruania gallistercoris]
MRTTVNIDEHLLAEVKVHAARSRRSMTSLLEEALRRYLEDEARRGPSAPVDLPEFVPPTPGLRPGVDLEDREQVAELLGDNRSA